MPGHRGAVPEQPQQRMRDGRLTGPVAADEAAHHRQVVAEPPGRDDHHAIAVADDMGAQRPPGERAEDHRQVIDGLDSGVRVVDRRRQRLAGHVDELPDPERGVLLQGPLEPDPDRAVQGPGEGPRIRGGIAGRRRPDPGQGRARYHVFADPEPQAQGQTVPGGRRQQHSRPHRLHISRARGRDRHGPGRCLRRLLAAGQQAVLDHREGVALDRFHDRVHLYRVQQVVGEEHQQPQAGEQQHDRAADREAREGGGAVAARDTDGIEPGRAVGEGRHERAEHDLVRPVPQEVAQQPRRELGRGQLQRHHGQAEQQRDDGDHRPGDPEQQRPRVIRGSLEGQRRPCSDADR
ncbi:MAG TPA: hypothetical protein VFW50_45125 [Streptosporangiaceae bacterium]|nr:hypothetical protein [Streptosporangiaceae bacterium]